MRQEGMKAAPPTRAAWTDKTNGPEEVSVCACACVLMTPTQQTGFTK